MKNAPTTNSNESALDKRDCTPGELPKRINTVNSNRGSKHQPRGTECAMSLYATNKATMKATPKPAQGSGSQEPSQVKASQAR
jgi:hypothetical protein